MGCSNWHDETYSSLQAPVHSTWPHGFLSRTSWTGLPRMWTWEHHTRAVFRVSGWSSKAMSIFTLGKFSVFRVELHACLSWFSRWPVPIIKITCIITGLHFTEAIRIMKYYILYMKVIMPSYSITHCCFNYYHNAVIKKCFFFFFFTLLLFFTWLFLTNWKSKIFFVHFITPQNCWRWTKTSSSLNICTLTKMLNTQTVACLSPAVTVSKCLLNI